ncbi:general transcription factor 3C polypeptide 5-like [Macrosteles quadrilineatus]|uniref:general transcription factor 3C polypeptide 5-like n=1 Tax=Macrosteles quadrilineatus TaxID=74068 RepID=UPI0023E2C79B|nr:general transcription factor 3C polypeptide 5-like [Macrosteles quadrilineatus]
MNTEGKHNFDTSFVCVQYPGVVKNDDKMLESMGGIKKISKVYSERNRRLELRFRPDDVYCRPACADRQKVTGLLMSVKVRRKKNSGEIINITPTVLGKVCVAFKFTSLCDFQYLAMDNSSGQMECIYDKLVPKGILTPEWFTQPAPYFLPPATFSRMDTVQNYQYRQESVDTNTSVQPYHIGRTRRRRSGHAIFVTFSTASLPLKPRPSALKFLEIKFLCGDHFKRIKEMFQERPVWSKVALMCVTGYNQEQMKYLLPSVAYYFVTGPFRIMWVRFGFDPRKDPSARIYQSIDYRIRIQGGGTNYVKAKRSYTQYLLPYKSTPASRPKTAVISQQAEEKPAEPNVVHENQYVFRPGTIPPSRQMFYQLCDIKVPEIEAMVERLPRLPPSSKCHERLGWLPPGFAEQCRDIMNSLVSQQIQREQAADSQSGTSEAYDDQGDSQDEDQYNEDDVDWEDYE